MPEPRRDSEQRQLVTIGVLVIACVALGAALNVLSSVLLPFVMALLLVYVVSPLVDALEMRLRFPRGLAVLFTMLLAGGLTVGLVALIAQSVSGLEQNLGAYTERLISFERTVVGWLRDLGVALDPEALEHELQNLPVREIAAGALGSVAAIVSKAALTLLFFIFLILGQSPWEQKGGVWDEIDRSVNRYLRTKVLTSTAIGLVFGGVLLAFGIDLAIVIGLLAFLLNLIPTLGSIIAVLLTVPVVFVAVEPLTGVGVIIGLVVAQNVIGNGLEPKLMGRGLDLHPATILVGLGLWGLIWGVVGMLLSAPLMAILRIVLANYETTRPVAEALSGRLGAQARKTKVPT